MLLIFNCILKSSFIHRNFRLFFILTHNFHGIHAVKYWFNMITSSNGNIFRVTGPLCGEFAGHRWIPRTNGQWRGALMFSLICALNKRLSKQSQGWWFETSSRPLWRHCNETTAWLSNVVIILSRIHLYPSTTAVIFIIFTSRKATVFREIAGDILKHGTCSMQRISNSGIIKYCR